MLYALGSSIPSIMLFISKGDYKAPGFIKEAYIYSTYLYSPVSLFSLKRT